MQQITLEQLKYDIGHALLNAPKKGLQNKNRSRTKPRFLGGI